MAVSLRDAREHRSDRVWIERVYRDYLDDLGLLNTGVFPALGEIGHREPDLLQHWYGDPGAHLITILESMNPAGFALVTRQTHAARTSDYRMADFFIAREARRRGVGQGAVRLICDRFAGRWEVVEYSRNPAAVAFWRKAITQYTRGNYQERVANGEVRQTFVSGRHPAETTR
jgi:predicted acetyltransferase